MLRLNTDSQPRESVAADGCDNRFETIVSASRSARPNSNLSKRQRQVIGYHDQPLTGFRRRLILPEQTGNSFAAQIHVGLRLDEFDRTLLDLSATYERLAVTFRYLDACVTR